MAGRPNHGDLLASPSPPAGRPDASAVRDHLDRLLASPLFGKSKRCGPFLSYVVEETLQGRGPDLKERRIGIDVFGRPAGYDTSTDPVVRTTAIEVRKRLAQYYQEPGHQSELRIVLESGHYAPDFHPPPCAPPEPAPAAHSRLPLWAAAVALLVVAAAAAGWFTFRPGPVKVFWEPLLDAPEPVTIAIGDALDATYAEVPRAAENERTTRVGFVDSVVQSQVAAFLEARGKKYEIRLAGSTTLSDLKRAPTVLVGAFNNVWTMSLQQHLPFFVRMDQDRLVIIDRQKPAEVLFSQDRTRQYSQSPVDYALVARFVDPRTQQIVLMLAGLGGGATRAAGEFVTNPGHLQALAAQAPPGWSRMNFEAVLAVDMANAAIGAPRIAALRFW